MTPISTSYARLAATWATNNPTSWALTAGDSAGYFAIITVTATGASGLAAGSYTVTIQAINSGGSGSNSATITVH
jgi:hypothetical protein